MGCVSFNYDFDSDFERMIEKRMVLKFLEPPPHPFGLKISEEEKQSKQFSIQVLQKKWRTIEEEKTRILTEKI